MPKQRNCMFGKPLCGVCCCCCFFGLVKSDPKRSIDNHCSFAFTGMKEGFQMVATRSGFADDAKAKKHHVWLAIVWCLLLLLLFWSCWARSEVILRHSSFFCLNRYERRILDGSGMVGPCGWCPNKETSCLVNHCVLSAAFVAFLVLSSLIRIDPFTLIVLLPLQVQKKDCRW